MPATLTMQLNAYSIALLVVALISGMLFLFVWSRRRATGAKLIAYMMLALVLWSGGYSLELASLDKATMLSWVRIEYLGITTLPVLWLLFALRYTHNESWLVRINPLLFFIIPACTLILHYTNDWHHLFYTDTYVDNSGPFPTLAVGKGPWYWVNVAYGYLSILTGSLLLLRYRIFTPHLYRRQAWAIVLSAITPLVGNILYQLRLTPLANLDLTPFAFAITGVIIIWGLYRLRLFDVTPLARDRLIEKLRDGMLVLDAQGRIVDLNPAARRYLALSNEVVGQELQAIHASWPELTQFASSRTQTRTEIELKQEQPYYLEVENSPLLDRQNRFVGTVLVLRDITERKEAEAAWQARQVAETAYQAIRQIVDTVEEGLVLLDDARRVVMTNRMGAVHLNLLAGAGVGDSITALGSYSFDEIIHPSASLPYRMLTVEQPAHYDFEVAIHPLQQKEILGSWLLVTRDVTRIRQIQQDMETQGRLAAVGQLAAGIAHDFNNVLAVIVLYTELLQRAPNLLPAQKRQLDVLRQQADHASHFVQQILDFGRKTIIQLSVIDLVAFLDDFVILCRRTFPETIDLELTCEPGQYTVLADRTRLQQVFMNLAVNARDAMAAGGKLHFQLSSICVEADKPPLAGLGPGEWIVIRVSDTGTGIEPSALPHIFEPFYTTKAPNKGTGLGLAQVFGIIKQHNGEIQVESQPGQGTVFTLYLPPSPLETTAPTAAAALSPVGKQETVLVVEDQPALREAVRTSLVDLSYRVLEASDGKEAVELFEQSGEQIDLVVSDIVMPRMDGIELYRKLKVKNPALKMILVTGYPLDAEGQAFIEQETVTWIQKPYSISALAQQIRTILDTPNG